MRYVFLFLSLLLITKAFSQLPAGLITGIVLDEMKKPLAAATIELIPIGDNGNTKNALSAQDGAFKINAVAFGYYRLQISFTGFQTSIIDSIHFRQERFDFNLDELVLLPKDSSQNMNAVVVYAEKPLIQNVEGNIIFNAGESALSAGSNAADLLATVPLITQDGDGKILVKGKEPKILIDDKPVEMNLQQLQDFLESMPGSAIEKIEILTNPPPQYAMETGGVINIVTKKNRVGQTIRLALNAGTRGERGSNLHYSYRRQGLNININGGLSQNNFQGEGYYKRENIFKDSSNFFTSTSHYKNNNRRPNLRMNVDYDISKRQSLNAVLQYNGNEFINNSFNEYQNANQYHQLYRLSQRTVKGLGENKNVSGNITYTLRTKKPGEVLRIIGGSNFSINDQHRFFYQQFLNMDRTPNGKDSTQQQLNENNSGNGNLRVQYDVPLKAKTSFLSLGTFHQLSISNIQVNALYIRKSDGASVPQIALSNHFQYRQYQSNYRASIKQLIHADLSITAGIAAEATSFQFNLYKNDSTAKNLYWSFLPFANINKKWNDVYNLTASYRRTIIRPGIDELNPTRDESDPYNIRFGNPDLKPSMAHNFDLVVGKNKPAYYANIGFGYNLVQNIYSQLRERINDYTTLTTWQNISQRQELEISTWNGYTINKMVRLNMSANYRYNLYGTYDKEKRAFRNSGSFSSNLNANFKWSERYNTTTNFNYNRFANPQGTARSNLSMNLGMQARLMDKKLTLTANVVDPFTQQANRRLTYGTNFILENYNTTHTRNYRLTVAYNLSLVGHKKRSDPKKAESLQSILQKDKT